MGEGRSLLPPSASVCRSWPGSSLGPRLPRPPFLPQGRAGGRPGAGRLQSPERTAGCFSRVPGRSSAFPAQRTVHMVPWGSGLCTLGSLWRQGKAGGDSGRLPASGSDSEPGCASRKRTGRRGSTGSVRNHRGPRPEGARSLPEVWVQLRELWAPGVKRGQPPRREEAGPYLPGFGGARLTRRTCGVAPGRTGVPARGVRPGPCTDPRPQSPGDPPPAAPGLLPDDPSATPLTHSPLPSPRFSRGDRTRTCT